MSERRHASENDDTWQTFVGANLHSFLFGRRCWLLNDDCSGDSDIDFFLNVSLLALAYLAHTAKCTKL
ncbi:hypothetical protein M378DRAFT_160371 [Amanita muscaria Koide BX008]|uniref:Uncharacterized protein n=1 Tax=Amanita muscaria (strain Koide BX008) TaxID=946122 RepID=A0A0C2XDD5_AMAMK|nr:hypothetical protein M378DRAFT_160371 [Amanita muscaria Koide BX008]